jgi:hypothetical protein
MLNWEELSAVATAVAALATAGAAAFTASMAKQTKISASATQKSVEQAEEQLKVLKLQTDGIIKQAHAAQQTLVREFTPLLIPIAFGEQDLWEIASSTSPQPPKRRLQPGVHDQSRNEVEELRGSFVTLPELDGRWFIHIEMRNIGAGAAVASTPDNSKICGSFWQSSLPGELYSVINVPIKASQPVVPPGGSVRYVALIEDFEHKVWQYLDDTQSEPAKKQIPVTFAYQDFALQHTYRVSCLLSFFNRKLLPEDVRFTDGGQVSRGTTIGEDLE